MPAASGLLVGLSANLLSVGECELGKARRTSLPKAIRALYHLTQEKQQQMGISPSTLHRLEMAGQNVTLKAPQQLVDRLKCSINDLFPEKRTNWFGLAIDSRGEQPDSKKGNGIQIEPVYPKRQV